MLNKRSYHGVLIMETASYFSVILISKNWSKQLRIAIETVVNADTSSELDHENSIFDDTSHPRRAI